jgi:hypothetical protein
MLKKPCERCHSERSEESVRRSRKYAYQVLLAEELSGCGVELVFLQAPSGTTPEDPLLVQFQGDRGI